MATAFLLRTLSMLAGVIGASAAVPVNPIRSGVAMLGTYGTCNCPANAVLLTVDGDCDWVCDTKKYTCKTAVFPGTPSDGCSYGGGCNYRPEDNTVRWCYDYQCVPGKPSAPYCVCPVGKTCPASCEAGVASICTGNYTRLADLSGLNCKSTTCGAADKPTCCAQTCAAAAASLCTGENIPRPNLTGLACKSYNCTDADIPTCCLQPTTTTTTTITTTTTAAPPAFCGRLPLADVQALEAKIGKSAQRLVPTQKCPQAAAPPRPTTTKGAYSPSPSYASPSPSYMPSYDGPSPSGMASPTPSYMDSPSP